MDPQAYLAFWVCKYTRCMVVLSLNVLASLHTAKIYQTLTRCFSLPSLPWLLMCTCPWRQHSDISDLVIFQGLNPVIKFCSRSWAKHHRSGTNRPHGPIKNERKLPKKSPLQVLRGKSQHLSQKAVAEIGAEVFWESVWFFKEYKRKLEFISFYSEANLSLWQWNILQDMKGGVNLHTLNKHIYVY